MRLETLPKQLKFIAIFCLSLFSVLESVAQCDFNFIGGNTGCAPLLIKARHVPEPNVVSRDWDILDQNGNVVLNLPVNNNPSNDSLVSIFPSCGNFSVRLIVTYTNAPSCTIVKPFQVFCKPSGGITFNLTEGCAPLAVQVQCNYQANCATPGNITIDWGGGGTPYSGVGCPPSGIINKVYTAPQGYYTPKLILTNGCGCDTTINYDSLIHIINKPVANFVADQTTANCSTSPMPVIFTANNAGANMIYEWYIDNVLQTGASGTTFSHTFPLSNLCYTIMLKVRHPSGGACADSMVRSNYICNRPAPTINFFQNISTGCVDAQTPANLILSNDSADGLNTLQWTLTGGTPPQSFPVLNGANASYQISVPGTYTVTAVGSFGPGCTDTKTQQVFVASLKPDATVTVNDSFSCLIPFQPTYTASVTNCPGCTYAWTAPPGSSPASGSATTFSPSYASYGCRYNRLIVTSNNGCTDSVFKNNAACIVQLRARMGLNKVRGCAPLCGTFTNTTSLTNIPDPIASVCWSFPGSTISSECNTAPINRCFNTPGCYDVKLVVATTTGCIDSVSYIDTVCVANPPTCSMTAQPLNYCYEADSTCFNVNCSAPFSYIRCDYGDGVIETVLNSSWCHFYQDTGLLTTKCIVYTDSCAGDTFTRMVNIFPPIAAFHQSTQCSGSNNVTFINDSQGNNTYQWSFCDGTTSTDINPTIPLPSCTTCSVSLTASNPNGCTHTKTQQIQTPCSLVDFIPKDTVVCVNRQIIFSNTSTSFIPGTTRWDYDLDSPPHFTQAGSLGDVVPWTYTAPGIYKVGMVNRSPSGCIDTVKSTVTVCKLTADFGPTSVCLPLPICFQNLSLDTICPITTYRWTFGDGTTDTVRNPCHTYATPGSYQVKLYIESSACRDSITKTVLAATPVNLNYTVDTLLCPGSTSCVINNSVGAPGIPLTYNWNIPNSNISTSTSPSPCFSYSSPGSYPVYLQIASGNQCIVYDTFVVHNQYPVASGYLNEDTILCPQPPVATLFTSTSMYYDSTLTWSFGNANNNQSNFANATFFYTEPGVYPVRLRVRTKDGCVSTTWIDTVVVKGPYGTMTADPTGMCACKDTVTLSISTVDASSLTLLYGCNFAGPSVNISPIGTDQNPTVLTFPYTYCITDTCKPQLIFGDNGGCQIYLEQPPIVVDSPQVGFSFDNYGVCVNGIVCFQDTTRYHLPSSMSYTVTRVWDYGDGSPLDVSNNPSPCHYYGQPGGYTTKLWVYSNLGCIDSVTSTVVVVPEFPIAGYYADDSLVCATVPMCFHDTSFIYPLTGADYWVWYWGDGKIDTTHNPDFCHAYDQGGYYRVTMCVYDSVGCPDCDSSIVIRVIDNPLANAGPDVNVCYGITTQINGSGGTAVHWEPAGLFVNPDVYNPVIPQLFTDTSVIIMVGDTFGCVDQDTARLSISRVFADFTVGAQFCRDDSICITDATTNTNGTSVTWYYDFGAGDTINAGANPCYVYPELSIGNYTITQLVVNNNGCMDTATHTINILPSPIARFSLNDTIICSDQQLCATDLSTTQAPLQVWTWSYGTGNPVQGQAPPCRGYTPPFQATYPVQLYVEDQNGCSDTALIEVTVNEIPQANFTWTTSCETDSMPLANTSQQGDGAIMGCEWLLWPGATNPTIDNNCNTRFQFAAGTYPVQLVVTDINGCTDTVVRIVSVDSVSQLTITPGDTAICIGMSVDYTVNGVFDQLIWQPNVWIDSPQSATVTITPQANITYTISAINGVCAAAKDIFSIRTIQQLPIEVDATPQQIVLGLSSNITSQIAGSIDSIIWSPDITLDCNNCPNPIATPIATTTYTATIYYSEQGTTCTTSDTVTIEVLNSCENSVIFVPNTFTPNGDGLNDIFMIRGIAATKINYLRVFDRWGQMVFEVTNGEANEPRWGWDGTNRSGEKLNPAVFVYTYEIECINGEAVGGKGNVTLVR